MGSEMCIRDRVDTIPFTVGGKVDRRAVDSVLAASAARHGDQRGPDFRKPTTALERALARIIADILGRDQVGAADDFFALGGDSVLAAQTVGRIRKWLDAPSIMVADIFAARTVAALATVLAGHESGSDRLEQVAELYLEVVDMAAADVATALGPTSTQTR